MGDVGRFHEAEALRKSGDHAAAAPILDEMWREHPTASVGWRLAQCLRKLQRLRDALRIATEAQQRFPEDEWVRRERVWCLYAAEIKPAKQAKDLSRLLRHAKEMAELADDDMGFNLACFSVIDLAKEKGKWEIVSDWCDSLDPAMLSDEPPVVGGRVSMSDRERWYFAKVKALFKLERWPETRQMALEGAVHFPRRDDFRRWSAMARGRGGDIAGAINELQALLARGNPQWYMLADMAELRRMEGTQEEALRMACRAALAFGEDKAKVNLFVLIAELGAELGYTRLAAASAALARAVREHEGWPMRPVLEDLERRASAAYPPDTLPQAASQLQRLCQDLWRERAVAGQQRYSGRVKSMPEGKKFAFITPDGGGEDVFVHLRDLPRAGQVVGAWVEYAVEMSFDTKKNREAPRAVDVRAMR